MAESNVIGSGNTLHIALGQRREECHDQAKDQRTGKYQPDPLKTRHGENHANHAGHIEGVVPGEKMYFRRVNRATTIFATIPNAIISAVEAPYFSSAIETIASLLG